METTPQQIAWAALILGLFAPASILHWTRLLEVLVAGQQPVVPKWQQPTQVTA